MQDQQRFGAVRRVAGVSTVRRQRDAAQLKLLRRGSIDAFLAAHQLPTKDVGSTALEGEDTKQFRDVDMLSRQPSSQYIVGVGHQLYIDPLQIRMQNTRRLEGGLPRQQMDQVQQVDAKDPTIAVPTRQGKI